MLGVSELTARLAGQDRAVALVCAVVISSTLALVAMRKATRNGEKLPIPDSTRPILGNTVDVMFTHRHRVLDWLSEESAKVSARPWAFSIVGRPPTVVLSDPEDFEDVILNHRDSIQRGPMTLETMFDFLGRGILITDESDWYFQRKVSSHLFSMKMLQQVMQDIVREKAELLCRVFATHAERKQPVSLTRELMHFTSDVFAKIGFGVELHCLESGLVGKTHEFVNAYLSSSAITKRRFEQPVWLWKLKRWLGLGEEGELKKHLEVVNAFAYEMISESIKATNATTGSATSNKGLVSLFLTTSMEERHEFSGGDQQVEMAFIRDMAINFIFAGKDSTSVGISWFIVMMNRYPEVLAKIRAEIANKVPGLLDGTIGAPDSDHLAPLVYLEAAIRENLRLNPPAHTAPRSAVDNAVLRDGTKIAKGSRVLLSIYASGRQPTVWGDDAGEFKPERWIDPATHSIVSTPPFKAFNFLAGPHMCPGRKMAMMEMKVAIVMLLVRFDFATVEDPFEVTYTPGITHAVKGPLLVKVTRREGSVLSPVWA